MSQRVFPETTTNAAFPVQYTQGQTDQVPVRAVQCCLLGTAQSGVEVN